MNSVINNGIVFNISTTASTLHLSSTTSSGRGGTIAMALKDTFGQAKTLQISNTLASAESLATVAIQVSNATAIQWPFWIYSTKVFIQIH